MTDTYAAKAANQHNAGARVRYGTYRNEDTGETTVLYLTSQGGIVAKKERR